MGVKLSHSSKFMVQGVPPNRCDLTVSIDCYALMFLPSMVVLVSYWSLCFCVLLDWHNLMFLSTIMFIFLFFFFMFYSTPQCINKFTLLFNPIKHLENCPNAFGRNLMSTSILHFYTFLKVISFPFFKNMCKNYTPRRRVLILFQPFFSNELMLNVNFNKDCMMSQANCFKRILLDRPSDVDGGCWVTPSTSIHFTTSTIDKVMVRIIPLL